MQIICTSLQTDNYASMLSLNIFTGQMLCLSLTNNVKSLKATDLLINKILHTAEELQKLLTNAVIAAPQGNNLNER